MADGYLSNLRSKAEDVRDDAERYGRRASGSLREAGRNVRDRGDDARGELAKLWGELEELVERRISPAASDAARQAGSYAREGRDMAYDMTSQLRDAARSQPLLAIGIAVAATWVISSMLRSKR